MIQTTPEFDRWLDRLRDRSAKAKIIRRIFRASEGNLGDVAPTQEGVSEMRIDHGPGYRVYFIRRGRTLIVLLAGGDKDSQPKDVKLALKLAQYL